MGCPLSVESRTDMGQFSADFDKQVQFITAQLAAINIPEGSDSLDATAPLYDDLIATLSKDASPTQLALACLAIGLHTKSKALSRRKAALEQRVHKSNFLLRKSRDMLRRLTEHGDSVQQRLEDAVGNIKALEGECKEQKTLIDEMETKGLEVQAMAEALSTQWERERMQHSDLVAKYSILDQENATVRQICDQLASEDSKLRAIIDRKGGDMKILMEACEHHDGAIRQWRVACEKLKTEKAQLEQDAAQQGTLEHFKSKAGQLTRRLERETNTAKGVEKKVGKLEEEKEQLRVKLADGVADVKRANEAHQELTRLRADKEKLHNLEVEVGSLRKQLKASRVKELEEQLREARADLDNARVELKRKNVEQSAAGPSPMDANLPPFNPQLSFPDAAVEVFKTQKKALRALRNHVGAMKDARGGNGWSIVERADGMVKETTERMIRDINTCLEVKGKGNATEQDREEELEKGDFPPLA
jgi:myosin heavy subunit